MMKRPQPRGAAVVKLRVVGSLDAALEKLRGLGGSVLRQKTPVPKMGWFAVVADPEMNTFGTWQDDPSAG
jgi:predicted enzyme related to lactoylglutathione lyase